MREHVRLSWSLVALFAATALLPLASATAQRGAAGGRGARPAATPAARTGAQVYAATCITCHQATGQGLRGAFPPLVRTEWVTGRPEWPIAIVLHGMTGEVTVAGVKYNVPMAALGATLSDQEIANVVTYVRSQWGNTGTPVTLAQVLAVRTATKSRTTPWSVGELKKAYP